MLRKRAGNSQTLVEEGGLQKYFFSSFFNVKLEFTLFSICVTFNILKTHYSLHEKRKRKKKKERKEKEKGRGFEIF